MRQAKYSFDQWQIIESWRKTMLLVTLSILTQCHATLGEPLLILALKNVTIVGDRMAFSGWSGGLMIIDLA